MRLFPAARKPLLETRIQGIPRLLTLNIKCNHLVEILWVAMFWVDYFFFLKHSFYNPGKRQRDMSDFSPSLLAEANYMTLGTSCNPSKPQTPHS